jgi:MADS-box transcription factor
MDLVPEPVEKPRLPALRTTIPKKLPQRKGHSIFTPIDETRSILSQHFSSFAGESGIKNELDGSPAKVAEAVRRSDSPPARIRSRPDPISEEPSITPPSRSSSVRIPPGPPSATVRPQLKVQIPTTTSEAGTPTGANSGSPQNSAVQSATRKHGIVLPPPSPSATASASALLSAGATGPPNPFARPQARSNNGGNGAGSNANTLAASNDNAMNVDTPVSSLPSRFLNGEFLPSPSNFYPEFSFRGAESNTLPSPLNFATPLAGSGPSFLREDPSGLLAIGKRKSPEISGLGHGDGPEMVEPKRVKVE